jgi:cellulose biosynthesis protein BcsQ
MSKIISIVASKGGVGKTTVSSVLAEELSKNFKVAVFDCDCDQYSIEAVSSSGLLNFNFMTIENEVELKDAIKNFKNEFDYIICDTAPHSHMSSFFLDILKTSDTVIGVTQPSPNDILAFEKIMLNVLDASRELSPRQRQFLLVNRVENIQSDIQKQSFELINDLLANKLNTLTSKLHNRAAFKSHGYFSVDQSKDVKKIKEVQSLVKELLDKGGL